MQNSKTQIFSENLKTPRAFFKSHKPFTHCCMFTPQTESRLERFSKENLSKESFSIKNYLKQICSLRSHVCLCVACMFTFSYFQFINLSFKNRFFLFIKNPY